MLVGDYNRFLKLLLLLNSIARAIRIRMHVLVYKRMSIVDYVDVDHTIFMLLLAMMITVRIVEKLKNPVYTKVSDFISLKYITKTESMNKCSCSSGISYSLNTTTINTVAIKKNKNKNTQLKV